MEDITEAYITRPKGYKAAGMAAGLKGGGKNDLCLVVSDTPANIAGVYTSNLVKGHSLVRGKSIIETGKKVRGILVNSKVANACVGPEGVSDAAAIANSVAAALGCSEEEILTASTGVIGPRLPVEKIQSAVPELVSKLGTSPEDSHNALLGMMTTDTVRKEVSADVVLQNGQTVSISGMAKGSGMIHPNLATMIGIFTTDADIDSKLLDSMLHKAVAHTFNRVSVDGDTSVCDQVTIFANGASGISIKEDTEDASLFEEALEKLSLDLSRMIADDGEGASKLVEVEVFGAKDAKDAKLIVSAIAKSPLCKTAIFGEDANCGRILTAAGYSGASFDPEKITVKLNGLTVCDNGTVCKFDEANAAELLHRHEINITVELQEGEAYDRMFTCDFTYDYVKINGDYRT